ncbi:DUF2255 family protein [Caballeronia sp. LZ032]|uniref:DUF2255 family protein n=1 Tax=Caballeronia sp. LZ032 TaxID=3038565 RepID=UPI002867877E|nr:DUF2255 family protein [Caballeronia sp. LZ032]MDR5881929.1 DUF2255 family protein [Caballeronia sp. LZ032]
MTSWSTDELAAIAASDDLHVSPLRDDGVTHGTPTWIWSVVVDGDLYVGAYNGLVSRWYQAALPQRGGRIRVAGMTRDVSFESAANALNDRVDDAYGIKYRNSWYLNSMASRQARYATVKISPCGATAENAANVTTGMTQGKPDD